MTDIARPRRANLARLRERWRVGIARGEQSMPMQPPWHARDLAPGVGSLPARRASMRGWSLVITGIIIAAVVGRVAQAAGSGVECPINHLSDGVEDALKAAPSCKAAVDLFWACGTGGSHGRPPTDGECEVQAELRPCEAAAARG
jgi:hypothetical protein